MELRNSSAYSPGTYHLHIVYNIIKNTYEIVENVYKTNILWFYAQHYNMSTEHWITKHWQKQCNYIKIHNYISATAKNSLKQKAWLTFWNTKEWEMLRSQQKLHWKVTYKKKATTINYSIPDQFKQIFI